MASPGLHQSNRITRMENTRIVIRVIPKFQEKIHVINYVINTVYID